MANFGAALKSGEILVTTGTGMSNEQKSAMCNKICNTVTKTTDNTPSPLKDISSPITKPVNTSSIAFGNVDKRVALTVSPKTYQRDETIFVDKVKYVLGTGKIKMSGLKNNAKDFFGLLRNALGTSSGLIFPYTPTVSFSHQTNYSPVEIIHSNITYQYYKNSPPPSISLSAKFTADNRDNALHMLSAIWFLIACSKCDFGEKSDYPGLPPPVLYLNGYDHLIDNVPVVITSVKYSYPETKHYVNLVLDFSQQYNHRGKEWEGGDKTFDEHGFCKIYTTENRNAYSRTWETLTDIGSGVSEIKTHNSIYGDVRQSGLNYSFWLPTDIQIDIGLAVQPNLLKVRKQWKLENYKTGMLLTDSGKNPNVWLPNSVVDDKLLGAKEGDQDQQDDCPCTQQEPTSNNTGKYMNFIPSGWTW